MLIPLVVASGFLMEQLDSAIITTAIPAIAVLPLAGLPGFLSLSPDVGIEVSGHRRGFRPG